ncbi:MAG: methyltransferase domain-containing protein [Phycisphaerales bacterium]|nr:methyltransferase domain-containing protein [Phycisphaerales bacterium]
MSEKIGGIRGMADWRNPKSMMNRMRQRRFEKFDKITKSLGETVSIIDLGGTVEFWERRGWAGREDRQITLINLEESESKYSNIQSKAGDATRLDGVADGEFDIAFSNSVIEHVFTYENQEKMAAEVRRVAGAYWVQTPNYWFPMEPHFHVPGWQWLPKSIRYSLIRRRRCGWRGPERDPEKAKQLVDEVRLVTKREMRKLFPDSTLWGERFGPFVKSWVAYSGFPEVEA